MTVAAFAGVQAKIDRANKCLAQFEPLQAALDRENKKLLGEHYDPQSGERTFYFLQDPVVDVEFALLGGDVLQYLRSALDHLAFALCAAGPGGRAAAEAWDGADIAFPITRWVTKPAPADAFGKHPARGPIRALAKSGTLDEIQAVEAYKGGAGHIFAVLGALNNTDKHRVLVTVAVQSPEVDMSKAIGFQMALLRIKNGKPFTGIADLLADAARTNVPPFIIQPRGVEILKAGSEVFRDGRRRAPFPHRDHLDFSFPIALNEPQIVPAQPLIEMLQEMTDAVSGLLPRFEAFL